MPTVIEASRHVIFTLNGECLWVGEEINPHQEDEKNRKKKKQSEHNGDSDDAVRRKIRKDNRCRVIQPSALTPIGELLTSLNRVASPAPTSASNENGNNKNVNNLSSFTHLVFDSYCELPFIRNLFDEDDANEYEEYEEQEWLLGVSRLPIGSLGLNVSPLSPSAAVSSCVAAAAANNLVNDGGLFSSNSGGGCSSSSTATADELVNALLLPNGISNSCVGGGDENADSHNDSSSPPTASKSDSNPAASYFHSQIAGNAIRMIRETSVYCGVLFRKIKRKGKKKDLFSSAFAQTERSKHRVDLTIHPPSSASTPTASSRPIHLSCFVNALVINASSLSSTFPNRDEDVSGGGDGVHNLYFPSLSSRRLLVLDSISSIATDLLRCCSSLPFFPAGPAGTAASPSSPSASSLMLARALFIASSHTSPMTAIAKRQKNKRKINDIIQKHSGDNSNNNSNSNGNSQQHNLNISGVGGAKSYVNRGGGEAMSNVGDGEDDNVTLFKNYLDAMDANFQRKCSQIASSASAASSSKPNNNASPMLLLLFSSLVVLSAMDDYFRNPDRISSQRVLGISGGDDDDDDNDDENQAKKKNNEKNKKKKPSKGVKHKLTKMFKKFINPEKEAQKVMEKEMTANLIEETQKRFFSNANNQIEENNGGREEKAATNPLALVARVEKKEDEEGEGSSSSYSEAEDEDDDHGEEGGEGVVGNADGGEESQRQIKSNSKVGNDFTTLTRSLFNQMRQNFTDNMRTVVTSTTKRPLANPQFNQKQEHHLPINPSPSCANSISFTTTTTLLNACSEDMKPYSESSASLNTTMTTMIHTSMLPSDMQRIVTAAIEQMARTNNNGNNAMSNGILNEAPPSSYFLQQSPLQPQQQQQQRPPPPPIVIKAPFHVVIRQTEGGVADSSHDYCVGGGGVRPNSVDTQLVAHQQIGQLVQQILVLLNAK